MLHRDWAHWLAAYWSRWWAHHLAKSSPSPRVSVCKVLPSRYIYARILPNTFRCFWLGAPAHFARVQELFACNDVDRIRALTHMWVPRRCAHVLSGTGGKCVGGGGGGLPDAAGGPPYQHVLCAAVADARAARYSGPCVCAHWHDRGFLFAVWCFFLLFFCFCFLFYLFIIIIISFFLSFFFFAFFRTC